MPLFSFGVAFGKIPLLLFNVQFPFWVSLKWNGGYRKEWHIVEHSLSYYYYIFNIECIHSVCSSHKNCESAHFHSINTNPKRFEMQYFFSSLAQKNKETHIPKFLFLFLPHLQARHPLYPWILRRLRINIKIDVRLAIAWSSLHIPSMCISFKSFVLSTHSTKTWSLCFGISIIIRWSKSILE